MRVLLGVGLSTCARYPLPALFLRKVRRTFITFIHFILNIPHSCCYLWIHVSVKILYDLSGRDALTRHRVLSGIQFRDIGMNVSRSTICFQWFEMLLTC